MLPEGIKKRLRDPEGTTHEIDYWLETVVTKLAQPRLETRGSIPEYQRDLIEFLNHADGSVPSKEGISFSSNTDLYAQSNVDSLLFASGPGAKDPQLYVARVPRRHLEFNFVSDGYFAEYEFLATKRLRRSVIEDVIPFPSTSNPADSDTTNRVNGLIREAGF